jgi:hypothetical protein
VVNASVVCPGFKIDIHPDADAQLDQSSAKGNIFKAVAHA